MTYRRRQPTRGFTLVELLTAIAIIAILASLAFLAFRHVSSTGRANRTKVAMETGRNILTEYEHRGARMAAVYAAYQDLVVAPNTDPKTAQLPVPVDSVGEQGVARFGPAVIRTQRVMRRLMAVPAVKEAVKSLPKDAMMTLESCPQLGGFLYQPGDEVAVPSGNKTQPYDYWQCNAKDTPGGPPGGGWQHMGGNGEPPISHTQLLLDGNNNPIIFVPPGGLAGVNQMYKGSGDPKDPTNYNQPTQLVQAPGAAPSPTAGGQPIGSRPFFVAAGDDGYFNRGDDNHYSFDQ
ncbi:MAG TPA: prepilin-type N-terminal cleavage/methylation domain-containing protein [Tepidisphaeraceae bacterium]